MADHYERRDTLAKMKNFKLILSRTSGFSLIETLMAVTMISLVGIAGSRALLNSTKMVANVKYERQASSLAEMVFQQYNSYASQTYMGLSSYDSTSVAPKTFFNKSDNMGFDRMVLTTQTSYAADHSTATVKVTVNWTEGPAKKSAVFVRTFTQGAQLSGGSVQLYVISPCGGYTTAADLLANCPGIPGFTISAPSYSGTNAPTKTDATGLASMKNIAVGSGVIFQVKAPVPSDFSVPPTASNYVQGYYAEDPVSAGHYVISISTSLSMQSPKVATVVISNFAPLARVYGQLTNLSTVEPNPPVAGITLQLTASPGVWSSASGGSYINCTAGATCNVLVDARGQFSFNNMIPNQYLSYSIAASGLSGSAYNVKPGDPGFKWGYASQQNTYTGTLTPSAAGTPVSQVQNINITAEGWLKLKFYNGATNAPMKNYSATVNPQNGLLPAMLDTVLTDSNGYAWMYNVFTGNGYQVYASTLTASAGGTDYGSSVDWSRNGASAVGVETDLSVYVRPGFNLQAIVFDVAFHPSGIEFTQLGGQNWANYFSGTTNGFGSFSYKGFLAEDPSATTWTAFDPAVPFQAPSTIQMSNLSLSHPTAIHGGTIDAVTGQPAAHASVQIYGLNGTLQTVTSDSNGNFTGTMENLPYINLSNRGATTVGLSLWESCSDTTFLCTICNDQANCNVNSPRPLVLDTNQYLAFFPSDRYTMIGYATVNDQYEPTSGGSMNSQVPVTLLDTTVQGVVTDAYGHGVAGILLPGFTNDGIAVTTDATGHFGPAWAVVNNRVSASRPGTVDVDVPAQQMYYELTQSWAVPVKGDPLTPITCNMTLASPAVPHGNI